MRQSTACGYLNRFSQQTGHGSSAPQGVCSVLSAVFGLGCGQSGPSPSSPSLTAAAWAFGLLRGLVVANRRGPAPRVSGGGPCGLHTETGTKLCLFLTLDLLILAFSGGWEGSRGPLEAFISFIFLKKNTETYRCPQRFVIWCTEKKQNKSLQVSGAGRSSVQTPALTCSGTTCSVWLLASASTDLFLSLSG